jgi:hypothetical protein
MSIDCAGLPGEDCTENVMSLHGVKMSSPEEIVTEAVLEYLQLTDPETKTALLLNLSDQYLKSAGHRVTDGEGGSREGRGAEKFIWS